MSRRAAVLALVVLLALVAGCPVGPDYRRPAVPVPGSYRGAAGAPSAASLADLPWWDVFGDPALRQLIREALSGSLDLQQAVARMEQARALAGVAAAGLWPAVSVEGTAVYTRSAAAIIGAAGAGAAGVAGAGGAGGGATGGGSSSPLGGTGGGSGGIGLFLGQLTFGWELDVWGRLRRLREAALADYLASEEARRGVIVSLIGDVAQAYYQLLLADLNVQIARRLARSRADTLTLFREQEQGGVSSGVQTLRAEGNLAEAEAAIPGFERDRAQRENLISVLLGRAPGAIPRGLGLERLAVAEQVPAGLPVRLLARRPDVREAEARLAAASARIGAAKGDFFPRLSLVGSLGAATISPGGVQNPLLYQAGGAVDYLTPILNGAQIRQRYRASWADYRAVLAAYRGVVLRAIREVADALVAIDRLRQAQAAYLRQVGALRKAVDLAKLRFRGGLASYLEVVQAEQVLFPAELLLARTRADHVLAVVQLYRALGGGWQLGGPPAPRR